MEQQGVIRKITEHTPWHTLSKKDGSHCIDPQKVNKSLKRCPHKYPRLKKINHQFTRSNVFSKLNAKTGYCWSFPLDPDSQLLTTFRAPFGRYCWLRLPFGLRISQEMFRARMDEIMEDPSMARTRLKECGLFFNSEKCNIASLRYSSLETSTHMPRPQKGAGHPGHARS